MFVVYGYQGASDDPHKLALTNKLLEAVICEEKACGTGQPVIISGDLNAEPLIIPVTAKVLKCGHLIDLEEAYATGTGVPPLLLEGLLWMVSLAPRVLVVVCFLRDGSDLTFPYVLGLAWVPGLLRFRWLVWCHILPLLAGWDTWTGPGHPHLELFRKSI